MKVVQINSVCGRGSTGKICIAVSQLLSKKGIDNYILYSRYHSDYEKAIKYMGDFYAKIQAFKERLLGNYGFESKGATRKLVKLLDQIKPDIVHLHVLHCHDCNLTILFNYLREKRIKVYWTFHDCWALTSYCHHFDMIQCEKWKTGCQNCPQRKSFSWFNDKSQELYEKKMELIHDIDLTIITPSVWMANVVKSSFMQELPIRVINNGIDLELFKRSENSQFRNTYELKESFVVLGVAFDWGVKKGLDFFCRLAEDLPHSFQIVLVGTTNEIDKTLPANIISIHKTTNQQELVDIYSSVDLLFNPTREDTFPTVNIESLACGTPVLSFRTGGSPEILDSSCGSIVEKNDYEAAKEEIIRIAESRPFSVENCRERALKYNMYDRFQDYVNLYTNL